MAVLRDRERVHELRIVRRLGELRVGIRVCAAVLVADDLHELAPGEYSSGGWDNCIVEPCVDGHALEALVRWRPAKRWKPYRGRLQRVCGIGLQPEHE